MEHPSSKKSRLFTRPDQTLTRKQLRADMPPAEELLWHKLRERRLHDLKFRRQHGIGRYVVDFFCADSKLVIEVDGPTHDEGAKEYDLARQAFLESNGLTVVRFYNTDIYDNLDGVLERILEVVGVDEGGGE